MKAEDKETIREIVEVTVNKTVDVAVTKTLQAFGFKVDDVNGTQEDMAYLRRLRNKSDYIRKGFLGAVAAGAAGWFIYLVTGKWPTQ